VLFGVESVLEVGRNGLLQRRVDRVVKRERRNINFLGLQFRVKFLDGANDFLDLRVSKFERFDDSLFADFEGAGFNHHDGFFRSGNDDIQGAGLLFCDGGIGDELTIQQADTYGCDRSRKRKIGAISGSGGAGNGYDVGVILAIRGEDHRVDLGFIAPGLRE